MIIALKYTYVGDGIEDVWEVDCEEWDEGGGLIKFTVRGNGIEWFTKNHIPLEQEDSSDLTNGLKSRILWSYPEPFLGD